MRSKEVEDNINLLITYRGNLWQQHKNPKIAKAIDETIDYIEELEEENKDAKEYADDVWRQNQELRIENETNYEKACDKFNEDLKKLLAQDVEVDYIPKQVIRDKIKELEHEKSKRTQLGVFMLKNYENQRLLAQIEVLKEILGE